MVKPDDRLIRVIVAGGSLLVTLVIGLPLVDEFWARRQDTRNLIELKSQFESIMARDEKLRELEVNLTAQHEQWTRRSFTSDAVQTVRDAVLQIAKESNVRLRSLDVTNGHVRTWALTNDHPRSRQTPNFDEESPYRLHTHSLTLLADASLPDALQLAQLIGKQPWLISMDSCEIKKSGLDDDRISFELHLTLFGLDLAPSTSLDNEDLANS